MPELPGCSNIYVFIGGTRSGKSMCAEQKVQNIAKGNVLYVATAQAFSDDIAMQQRILEHQKRRPVAWELVECPLHIADALRPRLQKHHKKPAKATVLIDCVTLWVANMLFSLKKHDVRTFESVVRKEITDLLALSHEFSAQWVFVTGEVGLGGIGASALERSFHDGLGLANQLLVAQSTEAFLVVAGRMLKL